MYWKTRINRTDLWSIRIKGSIYIHANFLLKTRKTFLKIRKNLTVDRKKIHKYISNVFFFCFNDSLKVKINYLYIKLQINIQQTLTKSLVSCLSFTNKEDQIIIQQLLNCKARMTIENIEINLLLNIQCNTYTF